VTHYFREFAKVAKFAK